MHAVAGALLQAAARKAAAALAVECLCFVMPTMRAFSPFSSLAPSWSMPCCGAICSAQRLPVVSRAVHQAAHVLPVAMSQ